LIERMVLAVGRLRRFVTHGVWAIGQPGEEIPRGIIIKHVRVAIVLVRNLVRDALLLRASALTFATLLAIVPFLTIMFFVIKTFNIDEAIYRRIETTVVESPAELHMPATAGQDSAQPAAPAESERTSSEASRRASLVDQLIAFLSQRVAQRDRTAEGEELTNPVKVIVEYADRGANPQTIGLAGIVFVVTTVFGLMMNIESAFNTIWGLRRSRTWYRIFSDYMMVLILLPFLAALVLGVTGVLESAAKQRLGPFALGLSGIKYAVIWLAFTAIYVVVPNTRVRLRYAALGGVVSGMLWSLASWAYVRFQVGLPQYSLLYSTFAQVPMLLMWIFVSWVILLFGAELTFAYQNEKTYAIEHRAESASYGYREALGLWTMIQLGQRFDSGAPPLSAGEAGDAWNVPARLLNETLDQLELAGFIVRTGSDPVGYTPARSLEKITLGEVLEVLREAGGDPSLLREHEGLKTVLAEVAGVRAPLLKRSLADIVRSGAWQGNSGRAE